MLEDGLQRDRRGNGSASQAEKTEDTTNPYSCPTFWLLPGSPVVLFHWGSSPRVAAHLQPEAYHLTAERPPKLPPQRLKDTQKASSARIREENAG